MPWYLWYDAAVAFAIVGLAFDWVIERARLKRFVESLDPLPADSGELALSLAGRMANRPHRLHNGIGPPPRSSEDPPYIARFFAPLGSTPSALIRHGGCCSGTSRLYILTLGALGIPAYQITVYHRSGNAQHCLVEVHLSKDVLIADPTYGVFYTDALGRTLSLEDLQSGTQVECRPAPGALKPGYPANTYYDFDYKMTKTANWTKSWQRRLAYSLLRGMTRGSVDRLRVPQLLEWPQALLALALVGAVAVAHTLLLLREWITTT